MPQRRPPSPPGAASAVAMQHWASEVYRYLADLDAENRAVAAVRLRAKLEQDNPSQDGVLLYDRAQEAVVVSINGQWRKVVTDV